MRTDEELKRLQHEEYARKLAASGDSGEATAASRRAVYELGRADARPPTFREEAEEGYQAWRATQTKEELAAWDAQYNDDGSPRGSKPPSGGSSP